MRVTRNFDQVYAEQEDPWAIGAADSERYELYRERLLAAQGSGETLLDIGSGFGAFLSRFSANFEQCHGLELATAAVEKGRKRFPHLHLHHGAANDLDQIIGLNGLLFDAVICSDLIYYLPEDQRRDLVRQIRNRLKPKGVALFAAWCPGGDYLEADEFLHLIRTEFGIDHQEQLDSGHVVMIARPRRAFATITIDYETWQPIPEGKTIDWETDVFAPTQAMMDLCDRQQAPITLFVELGEYYWLQENRPETATRMEAQWQEAIRRGHDVQPHLHPHWLPENGARFENGAWHWDFNRQRIHDYPGSIEELIRRCKTTLETLLQPIRADYRVSVFRAGGFSAQPFQALHDALLKNAIRFDSSVRPGSVLPDRGVDYRHAYSAHQPYFANPNDPQLLAPPAERQLIELPIFTRGPHQWWYLDNTEGAKLADQLEDHLRVLRGIDQSSEDLRKRKRWQNRLRKLIHLIPGMSPWILKHLPNSLAEFYAGYPPQESLPDDYFVMIGHTKANLDLQGIEASLERMHSIPGFEFKRISDLSGIAAQQLDRTLNNAHQEAQFQVWRESTAILSEERNLAPSDYLQQWIPLDGDTLLDLGCGAGYWSARISEQLPWKHVFGLDYGEAFIAKSKQRYGNDQVQFLRGDFQALPFPNERLDCIYADNVLEHAHDVSAVLDEIFRCLKPGGALIAALPPDALNTRFNCDNHTWKTQAGEIRLRLQDAGFSALHMETINIRRRFGMRPFPPSGDQMIYLRAFRPIAASADDPYWRLRLAMDWVHTHIAPAAGSETLDPIEVIKEGQALCAGYAVALGGLLAREGYSVRWVSMLARGHKRGRGKERVDSHETVEVHLDDQTVCVLDAMSNTLIPHSLEALLKDPKLANGHAIPNDRYRERSYQWYDTAYWYERVFRYRSGPNLKRRSWIDVQPSIERIPKRDA